MLTVEIVKDRESFLALRNEWSQLLEHSSGNCVFLTWEWMYTWWSHLAQAMTLNLILVRRSGVLIAIAPMALRPLRFLPFLPFRKLGFIATGSVGSDYLSVLVRHGHEEDALGQVAACLSESGQVVELVRVEKSSFLMVDLALQLGQSGWQAMNRTTNYCPFINLSRVDWESYLESLHRSHRVDVGRRLKKLHKDFAVEFRTVQTEAERQPVLDDFIRLHNERWAGHGGSNAFADQALVDFHQAFSRVALEMGWLRLHTLSLNGELAAALYVFNYDGVCYYYQAAFDHKFAKYSVGMLMLVMCIRNAIEEKSVEFDFLHDDEEYKYLWSREERELVRFELFPPRSLGKICQQAMVMKDGLKRLRGKMQPLLLSGR